MKTNNNKNITKTSKTKASSLKTAKSKSIFDKPVLNTKQLLSKYKTKDLKVKKSTSANLNGSSSTTSKSVSKTMVSKTTISKQSNLKTSNINDVKKVVKSPVVRKPIVNINLAPCTIKDVNPSGVFKWFLNVPFEWLPIMSRLGVIWDKEYGCSVYKGQNLPPHLEGLRSQPFSLNWHKQYFANNGQHLEKINLLEPKFVARKHQKEASKLMYESYLSSAPGFLLADEVGVGKTMSAWDFALTNKEFKTILIVTTSSAQVHWRNTVLHAGFNENSSIVIINYDQLEKLFTIPDSGLTSTKKKGMKKRIAKQAIAPTFDLVIFDESHKGKNPISGRGTMMRKIHQKAKFTIFASATAGQNPIELIYLYNLLSFASGSKVPSDDLSDFIDWCLKQNLNITRGAFGKIIWDGNENDLNKINKWLFGGKVKLGIRRLPQDIANWPALFRKLNLVQLSPDQLKSYEKIWEDFKKEDMNIKQSSNKKNEKILKENNKLRLRQESSWLRIENTIEETMDLLEQNKKVAISVAFRNVMDEMVNQFEQKGINVTFIHGSLSPTEKENNRLEFQKGEAKVIVFTVEEAISLHQGEYGHDPFSRVLLVHDVRWSAIQMAQIEGRCHRDGKEAPVYWMVAIDTVDVDISEVMISKVKNMKAMHGDSVSDMDSIEKILERYINK